MGKDSFDWRPLIWYQSSKRAIRTAINIMSCYSIKQEQNSSNPVNKLKDNAVIRKQMRLIIGSKKITIRTIVKITDIVKGMLTL